MNFTGMAGPLLCGVLLGAMAAGAEEAPKTDAPDAPATVKPLTVVVWGDSIAAGSGALQWPAIAERMCNLTLNTGRPVRVINAGISGLPAATARTQFAQKIMANAPDVVIIQFGFNDLRYDGSRGNAPISTLAEFEAHLTDMVARCRDEAHARVIVFGNHRTRVNLVLPSGRTYDEARADYALIAQKVAARAKVSYHDLAQELKVEGTMWTDFLADDGVHLSPLGFNAYGRFAANVIAQTVK
ncbi:MAG TPA: SGNH/GDSL hydrolase family protein [Abditibacteriaceae bacterium]|nr:SGNH/GDSL hydrolase family protein [Abditibacteriaceae bacterium]